MYIYYALLGTVAKSHIYLRVWICLCHNELMEHLLYTIDAWATIEVPCMATDCFVFFFFW